MSGKSKVKSEKCKVSVGAKKHVPTHITTTILKLIALHRIFTQQFTHSLSCPSPDFVPFVFQIQKEKDNQTTQTSVHINILKTSPFFLYFLFKLLSYNYEQ